MAAFDLDAARKAREEVQGKPPTFTFGGRQFTFPLEAPYAFGEALAMVSEEPERARIHMIEALKVALEEQYADFRALKPTEDDVAALIAGIRRHWNEAFTAASPGESSASAASSSSGSGPSKPTSNGSTGSTSDTPSGGESASAPAASTP